VHRVVPEERLDAVTEQTLAYLVGLPRAAVTSVKRYFRERAGLDTAARDELQLRGFAANLDTPEAARSIERFAAQ
jgi:enoyl-CoA hydratase/carnithine racemase